MRKNVNDWYKGSLDTQDAHTLFARRRQFQENAFCFKIRQDAFCAKMEKMGYRVVRADKIADEAKSSDEEEAEEAEARPTPDPKDM